LTALRLSGPVKGAFLSKTVASARAPTKKPYEQKVLLKADAVTLTLAADKEGKIRVNCSSWDSAAVVLPGQVFEARWEAGQVMLVMRGTAKA
jgi:hypothetical protein